MKTDKLDKLSDADKKELVRGAVLSTADLATSPFWAEVEKEYNKLTKKPAAPAIPIKPRHLR